MVDKTTEQPGRRARRRVPAVLIEATPSVNGLGYWALASPILLFVGWFWVDIFAYFSPIPWRWLDLMLGVVVYVSFFVLPLGYAAHWVVTALPQLFQHAGWDVQPLEPVSPAEQYMVKYLYTEKRRAPTDRRRVWLRAAQGWVYLEIFVIFAGFIVMIPLFFSAVEFGFGR